MLTHRPGLKDPSIHMCDDLLFRWEMRQVIVMFMATKYDLIHNKWQTGDSSHDLCILFSDLFGGHDSPLISGHVNSPSQKGHDHSQEDSC